MFAIEYCGFRFQVLDLSRNAIGRIESRSLRRLSRLKRLNLDENQLHVLEDGALSYQRKLRWLSLRNNQVSTLGEPVFSDRRSPIHLDLRDNPLDCDCNLLWLRNLVDAQVNQSLSRRTGFDLGADLTASPEQVLADAICRYPPDVQGVSFRSLEPSRLLCNRDIQQGTPSQDESAAATTNSTVDAFQDVDRGPHSVSDFIAGDTPTMYANIRRPGQQQQQELVEFCTEDEPAELTDNNKDSKNPNRPAETSFMAMAMPSFKLGLNLLPTILGVGSLFAKLVERQSPPAPADKHGHIQQPQVTSQEPDEPKPTRGPDVSFNMADAFQSEKNAAHASLSLADDEPHREPNIGLLPGSLLPGLPRLPFLNPTSQTMWMQYDSAPADVPPDRFIPLHRPDVYPPSNQFDLTDDQFIPRWPISLSTSPATLLVENVVPPAPSAHTVASNSEIIGQPLAILSSNEVYDHYGGNSLLPTTAGEATASPIHLTTDSSTPVVIMPVPTTVAQLNSANISLGDASADLSPNLPSDPIDSAHSFDSVDPALDYDDISYDYTLDTTTDPSNSSSIGSSDVSPPPDSSFDPFIERVQADWSAGSDNISVGKEVSFSSESTSPFSVSEEQTVDEMQLHDNFSHSAAEITSFHEIYETVQAVATKDPAPIATNPVLLDERRVEQQSGVDTTEAVWLITLSPAVDEMSEAITGPTVPIASVACTLKRPTMNYLIHTFILLYFINF